jgi:hypothetical protein
VTVTGGNNQSVTVGQPVPGPITVRVADAAGTPFTNFEVRFLDLGFLVTNGTQRTDAQGNATLPGGSWTLRTTAGTQTITAAIDGIQGAEVTATGTPDVPVIVSIVSGDDQAGRVGTALPTPAVVAVLDQYSNPIPGETVFFTNLPNNGTVPQTQVTTDATGRASTTWTLGASGANVLRAAIMVTGAGNLTRFFAVGTTTDYSIELVFLTPATIDQKTLLGNAAGLWTRVITSNIAGADFSGNPKAANACMFNEPALARRVEDLLIYARFEAIDGPNGILAQAGPCFTGNDNKPVLGVMRFDTDDPLVDATAVHEMGHVIGFLPDLWNLNAPGAFQNPSCGGTSGACNPDLAGANTHFAGSDARAAFNTLPGGPWTPSGTATNTVPLENTVGGRGSRDSHWRESTFVNELMTPVINAGANPLSIVSGALMVDLGYQVDFSQLFPYTLGNPTGIRAGTSGDVILVDDVLDIPLFVVDPNGRIIRQVR